MRRSRAYGRPGSLRKALHHFAPRVEVLEDRRLLSVFTVNSTGDEPDTLPGDGKALTASGTTTLRAAIMEANKTAGKDTINFSISGAGPHIIRPAKTLPGIFQPVTIDGYTQPGSQKNTKALNEGSNAVLQIVLDGTLAPEGTNGLEVLAGNSTVRGLVVHSFFMTGATCPAGTQGFGIMLGINGGNVIEGSFIGIDHEGTSLRGNTSGVGIFSANNTIGGTAPESRNVISGNLWNGIQIGDPAGDSAVSANVVQGNYIGLDKDGIVPLSNDNGIRIVGEAHGNTIGGTAPGAGNVISGNRFHGVLIDSTGGGSNVIQGNFIGTDKTGKLSGPTPKNPYKLGNAHDGVEISSSDNVVGGTVDAARNVISGNGGAGILIVGTTARNNRIKGNLIGTDIEGTNKLGNASDGVQFQDAPENWLTDGNVISGNMGSGVYVIGVKANNNRVISNFIGTNLVGSEALGNAQAGVAIFKASANTVKDNVISANQIHGLFIGDAAAKDNEIKGNKIGTDFAGNVALPNARDGVHVEDAPNNTIGGDKGEDRNVISGNKRDGIHVVGTRATGNLVYGNYVGLDRSGTKKLPNEGAGVYVENASGTAIGGLTPETGNVISANVGAGIVIAGAAATNNQALNNYIGTDKDGVTSGLGNSFGVSIEDAANNSIGGPRDPGGTLVGNIISGNRWSGVRIINRQNVPFPTAQENRLQGNWIGQDSQGQPLGNGGPGVEIVNSSGNIIGEEPDAAGQVTDKGAENRITANKGDGVRIDGTYARGNVVRRNSIFDNQALGINLVGGGESLRKPKDGVTPNDLEDWDSGANNLMNFPVGVTAWFDGANTYISGTLPRLRPQDAVVDVYATKTVDPSRFGQGQLYLGSARPKESGAFHLVQPGSLPAGYRYLSATATEVNGRGSTSEFSPVHELDSDGDGLPDDWETKGIDFDGDGRVDLDLKALGARPDHKDIFVEIDYVEGAEFRDASIDMVRSAFAMAGIAFHANKFAEADRIPRQASTWFEVYQPGAADDFGDLKDKWFGTQADRTTPGRANAIRGARSLVFRYAIFAHEVGEYSEAGGISDLWGDDFLVATEGSDYDSQGGREQVEAGTFMHELGHCLGLMHGGPMPPGPNTAGATGPGYHNYKPNYLSIMNYSFQTPSNVPRPLDYSTVQLPALNENNALEETQGISFGSPLSVFSRWTQTVYTDAWSAPARLVNVSSLGGIDWNRSGALDAGVVRAYINDPQYLGAAFPGTRKLDLLEGAADWPMLRYNFRASQPYYAGWATGLGIHGETPVALRGNRERSPEEILDLARTLDADGDGLSNADDNVPFVANPDQTDSDGDGIGDAGELVSLALDSPSVPGGTVVTGTVTALRPAPADGLRIDLWTSDPAVADVPRTVTVPAGARSVTFPIVTTSLLASNLPVRIYALYWGDALSAELTVGPPLPNADLEVTQSAAPEPVGVGGDLAYTITVTNYGPTAATGVVLSDVLPAEAQLVSVSGTRTVPPPENTPLQVRFDYTYDGGYDAVRDEFLPPFFDNQEKRDLLEIAAQLVLGEVRDDLDPIAPSVGGASNQWTAVFENPVTGRDERIAGPRIEENELVIFVGARDLGDGSSGVTEGGKGGPGGVTAWGSNEFLSAVKTRGERRTFSTMLPTIDFAPWGGSIAFNTNPAVKYHFGATTDGLDADELDFLSVAMHELAHVLGVGTADSWDTYVNHAADLFGGPSARVEHDPGGPVPLDSQWQHWRLSTIDEGEATLMDPVIVAGTRELPTRLDLAAFKDIGWDEPSQNVVVAVPYLHSAGSVTFQVGAIDPGESVTVKVVVTPTTVGSAVNTVSVTGDGTDPDLANNSAQVASAVYTCPPLVVNSAWGGDDRISDGRVTTLGEAIRLANLLPGKDTIRFNIPGSAPYGIFVGSALPTITDPVVIDGTTQPGYAGTPVVSLSGPSQNRGFNGLHITAGNSVVRGLNINGFYQTFPSGSITGANAIVLENGGGNVIEGNWLGSGSYWRRGNDTAGILVMNSDGNRIGGAAPEARNVISGNYNWGILIYESHDNVIQGNYIGSDPTGQTAVGNGTGIALVSSDHNRIGGTVPGEGNVISGNRGIGIEMSWREFFTNTSHNRIEGNLIGVAADGTSPLGNGSHGIANWLGNTDNIIGGRDPAARNTIAFNGGAGVLYSTSSSRTPIVGNSIHSNAGLGIDLYPPGVDQNYYYHTISYHPDYPLLNYALSDSATTRIRGIMKGRPNTSFELDFYSSAVADPSGHGEGQEWLGTATVTTDYLGLAPFYLSFPASIPAGRFIAATSKVSITSEFSNSVVVAADRDGDGIADAEEDGGPNAGDANRDATQDSGQEDVATLRNTGDQQYLTLQSPAGTRLYAVWAVENPSPGNSPYAIPFPLGFLDGVLEGIPAGSSTTVTILLPAGVPAHSFYQFGATAGSTYDRWYEFLFDGTTGAEVFADRIVLHYVDGGRGDHDLTADGRITFLGSVSGPPAMHVVDVTPDPNTNQASSTPEITATFAKDLDPATVSHGTFTVYGAQSGRRLDAPGVVPGQSATVGLQPSRPFLPGELVQVTATNGIRSTDGEAPPAGFSWQFRAAVEGGTGIFAESGQRFGFPDTYGAALNDLDGDGDLDAFFANAAPEPNQVWLNDGQSNFADSGQRLGDADSRDVALGDLDGDGDVDALIATLNSGGELWLNDGQARFSDSAQRLGNVSAIEVSLGDLDRDGDLDAVLVHSGAPASVWLNDGQGRFTDSGRRLGTAESREVALGDLDADGDLDAFLVNPDRANEIWVNDGGGQLADSGQRLANHDTRDVALADADGDGDLDALVANLQWGSGLWLNDGQGRFSESGQLMIYGAMRLGAGDFDGDGDVDAFVVNRPDFGYGDVWLNDGQGRFQRLVPSYGGHSGTTTRTGGLALGDVDGDGDLDAIVANASAGWLDQTVMLWNRDGKGELGYLTHTGFSGYFTNYPPYSVAPGDVDADGDLDLVFGAIAGQVWLNDGGGHFRDSGQRLVGGGNPTLGDLDGDGDLDLLLIGYTFSSGYTTRVWLNDGQGVFTDTARQYAIDRSLLVRLGDVDGDADLDFVFMPVTQGLSSELWLNDGQARFIKSAQKLGTGLDLTFDIAFGDVDGDGDRDAFLANMALYYSDDIKNTVWLNDGQGRFTDSGQRLGFPNDQGHAVRLGDLDDDGDLDALVATTAYKRNWDGTWWRDYSRIEVWLNDGQGHFTDSGQRLESPDDLFASYDNVDLGDLDGDGDLDAFLSNLVWTNDGRGRFGHAWQMPVDPSRHGASVVYIALGDFDGDGDLDSVVRHAFRLALWLNQNPDQIDHPPTAVDDGYAVEQGLVLDVVAAGVLANDSEPEGQALSAVLVTGPSHADSFELRADGSFTYVPRPGFSGPDSFTYEARNPAGLTGRATVSVLVTPGTAEPAAEDDRATTQQALAVAIDVLSNDRDRNGPLDPIGLSLLSQPDHGTVSLDLDSGLVTYVPEADFVGTDQFAYRISGATGLSDSAAVTIEVLAGNAPPVAEDDPVQTDEDGPILIDVLANDSDPEGRLDRQSVEIRLVPVAGSIVLDQASGRITYTPDPDLFGSDALVYRVFDEEGAFDEATVWITVRPVNDPPVAQDDEAATVRGTAVEIDVLANDSDVDENLVPGSVRVPVAPEHGSAAVDPQTGAITYTPSPTFVGVETFTYEVLDAESLAATARVTVEVLPDNLPPEARDDKAVTDEEAPVTIDVAANDVDPDGNLDPTTVRIVAPPSHGSAADPVSGRITYTPAKDFDRIDYFAYEISDRAGEASIAFVTVTVTPINDPPDARDDAATIRDPGQVALDVLVNDTDPEDALDRGSLVVRRGPQHGTAVPQPNGTVLYTPEPDFSGTDDFVYAVSDDQGASDEATVRLTLSPSSEPRPPIAVDDAYTLDENGVLTVSAGAGLLANDSDPEGGVLAVNTTPVAGPSHGTLVLCIDGSFDYAPAADYAGTDSFSYSVSDPQGATAQATVTLTVNPVPDSLDLEGKILVVPGGSEQRVTLQFVWTVRTANFNNELWVYPVDDADGRIGQSAPGQPGYAGAVFALADGRCVFRSGQGPGAKRNLTFPGGTRLAFYIIQDATYAALLRRNPSDRLPRKPLAFFSHEAANPDQYDHLRAQELDDDTPLFSWEDRTHGGDRDFDDVVYTVSVLPLPKAETLGTLDFQAMAGLNLSAGDRWYGFQAARDGTLTAEARAHDGGTSRLTLYDESLNPLATSSSTGASRRIDRQVRAGEIFYLGLSGTSAEVDLRLANLVVSTAREFAAHGTGQPDEFSFDAASRQAVINGISYAVKKQVTRLTFEGGDGADTAVLRGTSAKETVAMHAGSATVEGRKLTVAVTDASQITFHGQGGADVALLFDTTGPDTFVARSGEATLWGEGFSNGVLGVPTVQALASSGGHDTARLTGSSQGDTFRGAPTESVLAGKGFLLRAKLFDEVFAKAGAGGDDRAYLEDSSGPDVLEAKDKWARLAVAADWFYQAEGFGRVKATASTPGDKKRITLPLQFLLEPEGPWQDW